MSRDKALCKSTDTLQIYGYFSRVARSLWVAKQRDSKAKLTNDKCMEEFRRGQVRLRQTQRSRVTNDLNEMEFSREEVAEAAEVS